MSLLGLPNELLEAIGHSLEEAGEIYALAQTCHRLFDVLIVHLYRHSATERFRPTRALEWAARLGREDTLQRAIFAGLDLGDPEIIHLAVVCGQENVFETLLEVHGGDTSVLDRSSWSLLGRAAHCGRLAIAQTLLERGADVAGANLRGATPISLASQRGHTEVIKLLLDRGADVATADTTRSTPLKLACQTGHYDVAKLLLDNGADATTADTGGRTPLHVAARENYHEIVELLLDHGAALDAECSDGWTPLGMAADHGALQVVQLLLARGANYDVSTTNQWTPLRSAADSGHLDIVKLLFEQGAEFLNEDDDGWPILTLAANHGHVEVCELLLDRGANINEGNMNEWTPLKLAVDGNFPELVKLLLERGVDTTTRNSNGWAAIHMAAAGGYVETFKLLVEHGADVMTPDLSGATALHIAASQGCVELLRYLVNMPDIDINRVDNHGRTAFFHAAMRGRPDSLRPLMEHRTLFNDKIYDENFKYISFPNFEGNKEDAFGTTPIFAATRNGHTTMVEYLLWGDASLEMDQTDGFGRTLLWWANKSGKQEIVDMLLAHARKNHVQLADISLPLERDPIMFEDKACWCDHCTRSSIHDTVSYACKSCDSGLFLICGDCYGLSAKCHDATHQWEPYSCAGSNVIATGNQD